ncbi:aerotaxis sensor receptor protein [Vibrio orientalis CIP 102891 = ATCC 33934]|uniref:Aerotaxis sensor receptor protein n=1 Tax=Vibrio orientalis CIP 102891 = ATCC 33934 TaxID=675816 RepID=C9QHL3_VIBOR|nr:PAS domain-containing methyl-accepting chemotaxis protein [Vibrio orientalis]EEX93744.1 aerotaxis sensor receptor protein [Vibrio orientalis CIP 102891 = ATCC 33934]EGU50752.1 aerotaxis sensor receptor protein [Vibrio orientalis CIP 102891 = ATCC 33934]
MRVNQPVTQKEVTYPAEFNLLSITKPSSHISYASADFCNVAGYTLEELVGQPHNIVRHPDMPPAAFENMWKYLKEGNSWMGIVKNRCKNGDHYWVDAFASPIKENGKTIEYQSVRLAPKREHVKNAEKLYAQLNQGKIPLKLKLPRTRLWQRLSLSFLVIALGSTLLATFSPALAIWAFFLFSTIAAYSQTRRLEALSQDARKVFDNPLMELLYNDRVDDISEIQLAFKMRQSEINSIVGRIQDSNQQVVQAASSSANNCETTAENLVGQTSETEQVAAAINEMHSTANEITQNAQSASNATDQASTAAKEGRSSVTQTINSINELSKQLGVASDVIQQLVEHGRTIGEVLIIIQGVAEQTNLLALNAAIEAARAGEQGRGFAVVADEVRQLAQRSHESTEEIQNIIKLIQTSTEKAVQAMNEGNQLSDVCVDCANTSGDKLDVLLHQVTDISDRNSQIAAAIEEMARVTDEMNSSVQSISDVCAATNILANDTKEECEGLVKDLSSQGKLVQQFRKL